MTLLSKFVSYVSRSLFLYGLTELRMGSTALALAHTAIAIAITIANPLLGLIPLAIVVALYVLSSMPKQPLYAAIIAAIPAAWMGLTQLGITALRGAIDPLSALGVFLRAEIGALHSLYLLHATNISELAYIFSKLSSESAIAIPMIWRAMSLMLREVSEMLHIHKLKREKTWKSLAMSFVRSEEVIQLFSEGLYLKRFYFSPRPIYSRKALAMQLALVALDIATLAMVTMPRLLH